MLKCDVCNEPTSLEEGTRYTTAQYRTLLSNGFAPEKAIRMLMNMGQAFGTWNTREEALTRWKKGEFAKSETDWLLCPLCAAEAKKVLPMPEHKIDPIIKPPRPDEDLTMWYANTLRRAGGQPEIGHPIYKPPLKSTKNQSACFIASVAFSPDAPEVDALRCFRDELLMNNFTGKSLVRIYYMASPSIAKWISASPYRKKITRNILQPIVRLIEKYYC